MVEVAMPNIGDALKKAVELKPEDVPADQSRSRPESVLMNSNRRRVFQFLVEMPCSTVGDIARSLGSPRSSIRWHVDKLVGAEYLATFDFMGSETYCPAGMISAGNMPYFAAIANQPCQSVYRTIIAAQGCDRLAIAAATGLSAARVGRCISALLEVGLVTRIKDGRHSRYFPTDRESRIHMEEKPVYREFARRLVSRLRDEHLRPDVSELKGAGVVIELKMPGKPERLVLPHRDLSH